MLDEHGQPDIRINARARFDRGIDELLGLVRGLIADGTVNDAEAELLRKWAYKNPDLHVRYPGNALFDRLLRIFADGRLDEDEREDLLWFLRELVGREPEALEKEGVGGSAVLPLTAPPPTIVHEGSQFVLTGRFYSGCRRVVVERLERHGAVVQKGVTMQTDYLLVGPGMSRDWKHTSHGRKIEKAVDYRDRGVPIAIVAEAHWLAHCRPIS